MRGLRKSLFILVVMILLTLTGVVAGWYYGIRSSAFTAREEVDSVVLMEKIRNVHKLVLIEGAFSEIYDYEDYWMYDVSPLRRKALVRVQATVQAGFDLEKAGIEFYETSKTVKILFLPPSEILSIDHELDYYDLQEGTFNQFDEAKLTEIGKGAKKLIREQAVTSGLLEEAEERKAVFLTEISNMIEAYGWHVVMPDPLMKQEDSRG